MSTSRRTMSTNGSSRSSTEKEDLFIGKSVSSGETWKLKARRYSVLTSRKNTSQRDTSNSQKPGATMKEKKARLLLTVTVEKLYPSVSVDFAEIKEKSYGMLITKTIDRLTFTLTPEEIMANPGWLFICMKKGKLLWYRVMQHRHGIYQHSYALLTTGKNTSSLTYQELERYLKMSTKLWKKSKTVWFSMNGTVEKQEISAVQKLLYSLIKSSIPNTCPRIDGDYTVWNDDRESLP